MTRRPPGSTRTDTPFPYTPRFRSVAPRHAGHRRPATPGRRAARAARGPATDIRPRRTDPLRRSGGADRGKPRDPDRRRGRHRVAGPRGWDPFRLAPPRSRRDRKRLVAGTGVSVLVDPEGTRSLQKT